MGAGGVAALTVELAEANHWISEPDLYTENPNRKLLIAFAVEYSNKRCQ